MDVVCPEWTWLVVVGVFAAILFGWGTGSSKFGAFSWSSDWVVAEPRNDHVLSHSNARVLPIILPRAAPCTPLIRSRILTIGPRPMQLTLFSMMQMTLPMPLAPVWAQRLSHCVKLSW